MSNKNKEIFGLHRITKKHLKDLCKKHRLYQTPHLNDQLYLHFQGFQAIENLEEYTGLKCLWLESNAISEIQGLDCQAELKCLFLQNNLIKKIENLQNCPELDTLNLASNHITKIENCGVDVLPVLSTLNLSRNYLRNSESLKDLVNCKNLWSLDLSNNRIDDILVVKIFSGMPELRVLVLQGNPVVSQVPQYRKTLILECKNLTYLDSRPVFPKDRACAEAWKRGGYEEERREHDRWVRMDRKKIRDCVNATLRLRQKHGHDVQLLVSSDEEEDEEQRLPKKLRKEHTPTRAIENGNEDRSGVAAACPFKNSDSSSSSLDASLTSLDDVSSTSVEGEPKVSGIRNLFHEKVEEKRDKEKDDEEKDDEEKDEEDEEMKDEVRSVVERNVEEKSVEKVVVEERSAEEAIVEERSAEEVNVEERRAEEVNVEKRSAEEVSFEERRVEEVIVEERSAEEVSFEERSAEEAIVGERSAEERSAEERSAEERSAEEVNVEKRSAEEAIVEERSAKEVNIEGNNVQERKDDEEMMDEVRSVVARNVEDRSVEKVNGEEKSAEEVNVEKRSAEKVNVEEKKVEERKDDEEMRDEFRNVAERSVEDRSAEFKKVNDGDMNVEEGIADAVKAKEQERKDNDEMMDEAISVVDRNVNDRNIVERSVVERNVVERKDNEEMGDEEMGDVIMAHEERADEERVADERKNEERNVEEVKVRVMNVEEVDVREMNVEARHAEKRNIEERSDEVRIKKERKDDERDVQERSVVERKDDKRVADKKNDNDKNDRQRNADEKSVDEKSANEKNVKGDAEGFPQKIDEDVAMDEITKKLPGEDSLQPLQAPESQATKPQTYNLEKNEPPDESLQDLAPSEADIEAIEAKSKDLGLLEMSEQRQQPLQPLQPHEAVLETVESKMAAGKSEMRQLSNETLQPLKNLPEAVSTVLEALQPLEPLQSVEVEPQPSKLEKTTIYDEIQATLQAFGTELAAMEANSVEFMRLKDLWHPLEPMEPPKIEPEIDGVQFESVEAQKPLQAEESEPDTVGAKREKRKKKEAEERAMPGLEAADDEVRGVPGLKASDNEMLGVPGLRASDGEMRGKPGIESSNDDKRATPGLEPADDEMRVMAEIKDVDDDSRDVSAQIADDKMRGKSKLQLPHDEARVMPELEPIEDQKQSSLTETDINLQSQLQTMLENQPAPVFERMDVVGEIFDVHTTARSSIVMKSNSTISAVPTPFQNVATSCSSESSSDSESSSFEADLSDEGEVNKRHAGHESDVEMTQPDIAANDDIESQLHPRLSRSSIICIHEMESLGNISSESQFADSEQSLSEDAADERSSLESAAGDHPTTPSASARDLPAVPTESDPYLTAHTDLEEESPLKDEKAEKDKPSPPKDEEEPKRAREGRSKEYYETYFGDAFDTDDEDDESGLFHSFQTTMSSFPGATVPDVNTPAVDVVMGDEGTPSVQTSAEAYLDSILAEATGDVEPMSDDTSSTLDEVKPLLKEDEAKVLDDPEISSWLRTFLKGLKEEQDRCDIRTHADPGDEEDEPEPSSSITRPESEPHSSKDQGTQSGSGVASTSTEPADGSPVDQGNQTREENERPSWLEDVLQTPEPPVKVKDEPPSESTSESESDAGNEANTAGTQWLQEAMALADTTPIPVHSRKKKPQDEEPVGLTFDQLADSQSRVGRVGATSQTIGKLETSMFQKVDLDKFREEEAAREREQELARQKEALQPPSVIDQAPPIEDDEDKPKKVECPDWLHNILKSLREKDDEAIDANEDLESSPSSPEPAENDENEDLDTTITPDETLSDEEEGNKTTQEDDASEDNPDDATLTDGTRTEDFMSPTTSESTLLGAGDGYKSSLGDEDTVLGTPRGVVRHEDVTVRELDSDDDEEDNSFVKSLNDDSLDAATFGASERIFDVAGVGEEGAFSRSVGEEIRRDVENRGEEESGDRPKAEKSNVGEEECEKSQASSLKEEIIKENTAGAESKPFKPPREAILEASNAEEKAFVKSFEKSRATSLEEEIFDEKAVGRENASPKGPGDVILNESNIKESVIVKNTVGGELSTVKSQEGGENRNREKLNVEQDAFVPGKIPGTETSLDKDLGVEILKESSVGEDVHSSREDILKESNVDESSFVQKTAGAGFVPVKNLGGEIIGEISTRAGEKAAKSLEDEALEEFNVQKCAFIKKFRNEEGIVVEKNALIESAVMKDLERDIVAFVRSLDEGAAFEENLTDPSIEDEILDEKTAGAKSQRLVDEIPKESRGKPQNLEDEILAAKTVGLPDDAAEKIAFEPEEGQGRVEQPNAIPDADELAIEAQARNEEVGENGEATPEEEVDKDDDAQVPGEDDEEEGDRLEAEAKDEEEIPLLDEEKVDERIEERTEEKTEEKVDEKAEQEKVQKKVSEKVQEEVDQKLEEKVDQKLEEKIHEKIVKKVEQKREDKQITRDERGHGDFEQDVGCVVVDTVEDEFLLVETSPKPSNFNFNDEEDTKPVQGAEEDLAADVKGDGIVPKEPSPDDEVDKDVKEQSGSGMEERRAVEAITHALKEVEEDIKAELLADETPNEDGGGGDGVAVNAEDGAVDEDEGEADDDEDDVDDEDEDDEDAEDEDDEGEDEEGAVEGENKSPDGEVDEEEEEAEKIMREPAGMQRLVVQNVEGKVEATSVTVERPGNEAKTAGDLQGAGGLSNLGEQVFLRAENAPEGDEESEDDEAEKMDDAFDEDVPENTEKDEEKSKKENDVESTLQGAFVERPGQEQTEGAAGGDAGTPQEEEPEKETKNEQEKEPDKESGKESGKTSEKEADKESEKTSENEAEKGTEREPEKEPEKKEEKEPAKEQEKEPSSWWDMTLAAARRMTKLDVSTKPELPPERQETSSELAKKHDDDVEPSTEVSVPEKNVPSKISTEATELLENILAETRRKLQVTKPVLPSDLIPPPPPKKPTEDGSDYDDDEDTKPKPERGPPAPTLRDVLDTFNKVLETLAIKQRERAERLKDLINNPLTKEMAAETSEQINRQIEQMEQDKRSRASQIVDEVYAQKDKYNNTIELVDGRLMVCNPATGAMEDLPPPPNSSSKYVSCGVSTATGGPQTTWNDSESDDYGTALSGEDEDCDIEQHASDTKISKIPYLGPNSCRRDCTQKPEPDEFDKECEQKQTDSLNRVLKLHKDIDAEVFSDVSKWMDEGIDIPPVEPTVQKKKGIEELKLLRGLLGEKADGVDDEWLMETSMEEIARTFDIPRPGSEP